MFLLCVCVVFLLYVSPLKLKLLSRYFHFRFVVYMQKKTVINALNNSMITLCLYIPICTCVYTTVYVCAGAPRATLLLEVIGIFFAYALSVDLSFHCLQLCYGLKEPYLNVSVNDNYTWH